MTMQNVPAFLKLSVIASIQIADKEKHLKAQDFFIRQILTTALPFP